MRLFGLSDDGKFVQYSEHDFKRENLEAVLESWLEANPDSILEDSKLLIVGRQVTTNLGSVLDLLGVDQDGNLVVVELKRDRTPRDTLAQLLEYASFAEDLSYEQLQGIFRQYTGEENTTLADYHRDYFALPATQAVAFNKSQRLVIIAQMITREVEQTARFLWKKGIPILCAEFRYFRTSSGGRIISHEFIVGGDAKPAAAITSGTRPRLTKEQFLAACDQPGKGIFQPLLAFAEQMGLPLHWGVSGFSMNVDLGGNHVNLLYGYQPQSVYGQAIYTSFAEILRKVQDGEDAVRVYREKLTELGGFQPASNEMKWRVAKAVDASRRDALLDVLQSVAAMVRTGGLRE